MQKSSSFNKTTEMAPGHAYSLQAIHYLQEGEDADEGSESNMLSASDPETRVKHVLKHFMNTYLPLMCSETLSDSRTDTYTFGQKRSKPNNLF